MINITRLFCGNETGSEALRYGREQPTSSNPLARRPIVVWNITQRCNLKCKHCYSDSTNQLYSGELSTEEARAVLRDLADFDVAAVLFSGGEPLMRDDCLDLASYAVELGLRPTLSTNGTLINSLMARQLKRVGFTYIGISLDGIGALNDEFRGRKGAFTRAVGAFRALREVEQKAGLRMTLTRQTAPELNRIFDFIEEEKIPRACFYHLVYSGRGGNLLDDELSPAETRQAMDIILKRTEDLSKRQVPVEVLTVDNHVDGVHLYLTLLARDPERAGEVHKLLERNGGGRFSSGVGIGNIDPRGNVHPDQFWQHYSLGNVRERPFSEIWMDTTDSLMAGLKDRLPLLEGRCAKCRWVTLCGGSFRVRADLVSGNPWASDPACYLTNEEVGGSESAKLKVA